MKKLKSLERVERERERERESCILESKDVGLLNDFENGNDYNINKTNDINNINIIENIEKNINGRSRAMYFNES